MQITNQNIHTKGQTFSQSEFLEFFAPYRRYTTVERVELAFSETSRELITPNGCFGYKIIPYLSDLNTQTGNQERFYNIIINGTELKLSYYQSVGNGAPNPTFVYSPYFYENMGDPYLAVNDTIELFNGLGVTAEFYIIYHRIMFNQE